MIFPAPAFLHGLRFGDPTAAGGTTGKPSTAATDVWLNSGPGNRLDGGGPSVGATGAGSRSTEDEQLALALAASMEEGAGENSSAGTTVARTMEHDDSDVARAIALSLSQGTPGGKDQSSDAGNAGSGGDGDGVGRVYCPGLVPPSEPTGPETVRVQVGIKSFVWLLMSVCCCAKVAPALLPWCW